MSQRLRLKKRDTVQDNDQVTWSRGLLSRKLGGFRKVLTSDIEIKLTASKNEVTGYAQYNFKTGHFTPVKGGDLGVFDLLTLTSKVILKEELEEEKERRRAKEAPPTSPSGASETKDDLIALYGDVISEEELARLNAQPNCFDYSERVTQTVAMQMRSVEVQTLPPPTTRFSAMVSSYAIYKAYSTDFELKEKERRRRERELDLELERRRREREKKRRKEKRKRRRQRQRSGSLSPESPDDDPRPPPPPEDPPSPPSTPPRRSAFGQDEVNLESLHYQVKIVERMVIQNLQDEVIQDFKYWEDESDDSHPLEGSLLPLWRFASDLTKNFLVTDVCWSPVWDDLMAAAYTTESNWEAEDEGMICLYTIKNPGIAEQVVPTPRGVSSIDFHPTRSCILVAGRTDGEVMVLNFQRVGPPQILTSTAVMGKHLLPVEQVQWEEYDPGEPPSFYSVSRDGRLTQWCVFQDFLRHFDVIDFCQANAVTPICETRSNDVRGHKAKDEALPMKGKEAIEGRTTCLALHPSQRELLLLGTDTGAVFRLHAHNTHHALTRYHAHKCDVTSLAWNLHHARVFASGGVDWTVMIWDEGHVSPLLTLDLGAPVTSVTWAVHSSSVLAAATEDGRVQVYDFFERKCGPLCVQRFQRRKRVKPTCVAFNAFHPLLLVGGERGYVILSKLSPNLRKPAKESQEEDEKTPKERELYKMDRLIATCK